MYPYSIPSSRKPRPLTINDEDRRQWIANDEGLYSAQRCSRQSMTAYIRANRAELDAYIRAQLNREPAS